MKTLNTKQSNYLQDKANRVGGFELLPTQLLLPNVVIQPIDGFSQNTWIVTAESEIGDVVPLALNPVNNTISMLPGTEFSLAIGLSTDDVQTLNRYPYDIVANLSASFKWKKDDGYLFKYNAQNNGRGTQTLNISSQDCTIDVSGVYVCEITNGYGTVETEPVTINVLNTDTHPLLYKNLILDGDGNLDGWTADFDVKTTTFIGDIYKSKNFGSYRLLDDYMVLPSLDENNAPINETEIDPPNFYFCIANGSNLFPSILKDKGITNIAAGSISLSNLSDAIDSDYLTAGPLLPQIIPNEDYNYNTANSQYAGFYPGPYAIDNYNQNQNLIGLVGEFNTGPNLYFTRDKIKFEKFGGTSVVKMSQTIDVSEAADLIDGNVYGVTGLQGQFFAYVGAGITGYDVSYIDRKNQTNTLTGYGVTPEQLAAYLFNYSEFASPTYNNLADLYLNTVDARIDNRAALDIYVNGIVNLYRNPDEFIQAIIDQEESEEKKKDKRNRFLSNIVGVIAGTSAAAYGAITGFVFGGNIGAAAGASVGIAAGKALANNLDNILDSLDGSPQDPGPFEVEIIKFIKKLEPNYSGIIRALALERLRDSSFERESPKAGTNINVTPRVDDQTEIVVDYINASGEVIDTQIVNGPTNKEVWAVKEKIYFPLTQYAIDRLLTKDNNKVTVFDQAYYEPTVEKANTNSVKLRNLLRDKFDFGYGGAYPTINTWWIAPSKRYTNVIDRGAAAMFGVENTQSIPIGTRSVRITVYFKHLSGVDKDVSPELKGWSLQEIYGRDYKQDELTSPQLTSYGNPRCGITKMKFTLGINNLEQSEKYLSYYLPPLKDTVLGKALSNYNNANYYDLDLQSEPVYRTITTNYNSGLPPIPRLNELTTINRPPQITILSVPPSSGSQNNGVGVGGV
jgi:hypothetical protein